MILAGMLVLWVVAPLVLFVFLQRREDRRVRLRLALQIGAVVGAAHAHVVHPAPVAEVDQRVE